MSAGFPVPQNDVIDLRGNVIAADDFIIDGESIADFIVDLSDVEDAIVTINNEIDTLSTDITTLDTGLDNLNTEVDTLTASIPNVALAANSFLSTAVASKTFTADIQTFVTSGYSTTGDGGSALYKRVVSEPVHEGKLRSLDRFLPNGTTDVTNGGWWELDEIEIRPEMFGGAADSNGTTGNGRDNADAFDAMFAFAKAVPDVEIRFAAGYYRLSREVSQVDAGRSFTITGQGGFQTFLYGDFVGAGDYILNLSNSAGNSYSTRGHRVRGIGFWGNGVPGDPQGLGLENSFEHVIEDINAPNIGGKVLRNSVVVVTRDNNSKFNLVRGQCGWQPPAVSIPLNATVSFTSGNNTVTGNSAFFTTDMIGATIFFSRGSASAANFVWSASITDVPSNPSDTCTISVNAPSTQSNVVVGIGLVSGAITSGSDQLTLTGGVDIDSRYVGMQIHVPLASVKSDAGNKKGLLSTRIVSVAGNVLTLADNATATVSGQPVYFAPAAFLGSFEGEGGERQTNHSWWSDTQFEGFFCTGLIVNRAIYAKFDKLKLHGRGFFNSDWVQCYNPILMSEIKNLDVSHLQLAYGSRSRKMIISGSRGVVNMDNVEIGHLFLNTPPILIEEVTDEFALCPGLVTAVYGLTGFGDQVKLIEAPAPHNIEYGVIFTRDQRYRQKTRNTPVFTPGVTGQYAYVAINDDSVYVFRPPGNFGRLNITSPAAAVDGEVKYRTSDYPSLGVAAELMRGGVNVAVSTNVLTGTTGDDGMVTIGPDDSGNLRVENRRGFQIFIAFLVSPFGNVPAT